MRSSASIILKLIVLVECTGSRGYGSVCGSGGVNLNGVLPLIKRIITAPSSFNTPLPSYFKGAEELVKKEGYRFNKYKLTTQDGYILETHRVGSANRFESSPLDRARPPVLLMPGFIGVSDTFLLRNTSLAFMLVDAGYDVWMANTRGTYYSKDHTYLNNTSKDYWDFSVHELGYYDIPANVEFILDATGWPKLFFVGYSMGSTALFIANSVRPEMSDKLILTISMPPVASPISLEDVNSALIRVVMLGVDQIYASLNALNVTELAPRASEMIALFHDFLTDSRTRPFGLDFYGLLFGEHRVNLKKETFPDEVPHFPAGTSLKQFYHQIITLKRGLQSLDFGPEINLVKYNSPTPPVYSLRDTKSPVAIFYSDNDPFTSPKSAQNVAESLPNVVYVKEMPTGYNHGDYVFGVDSSEAVNARIIRLFGRYSKF